MADLRGALKKLVIGDFFHARSPKNHASLVCLVTELDQGTIRSRRVHTQDDLQFDRKTGIERGSVPSKIDCVTQLPPDMHQLLLEMDRKYQELYALVRDGREFDWERAKLTPDEKRVGAFIYDHVAANPISSPSA
jgi:hypothetical protein